MSPAGADRSPWIAQSLRARKPRVQGEILVRRLAGGAGYVVDLAIEEESSGRRFLPIARFHSCRRRGYWSLEWTSGDGMWNRLDEKERTMEEILDAIERDDFGCFFG